MKLLISYQGNRKWLQDGHKSKFPKPAVEHACLEFLREVGVDATISVHVIGWEPYAAQLPRTRYSNVPLFDDCVGDVRVCLRVDGRSCAFDLKCDNRDLPPDEFGEKLKATVKRLNADWRARYDAEAPTRELEANKRKLASLERRRIPHKKRLNAERRIIADLDKSIKKLKAMVG